MMQKILSLILMLTVFSACRLNGSNDKYLVEGTVKNSPAKSVRLEKLGLQQITVIDSSTLDAQGHFKMEGVSEKGFYRLKLDERTFFLFVLEPAHFTFDIDLARPDPIKIKGTAENDEFMAALGKIQTAQQQFNGWSGVYQELSHKPTSQDTMAFVAKQFQIAAANLQALVCDSSKTAKSPFVAMFYVTNISIDKFPKENLAVVERMEKEIPNSSYTKEFRKMYNDFIAHGSTQPGVDVGIGKPAPDIDLKSPDGKNIKLSSLKGKVVLLDFWASWCGPCRMEMPNVVAAYKKYKDKGFAVYSVSLDKDAAAWKNAINTLGMVWETQVSDLKWWQSEAAQLYGVTAIPAAFLIDKNGTIVATGIRGPELDKKIQELLQ